MVQLTSRDAAMLEWLRCVRMADTEAIRYALAGLAADEFPADPVTLRKAQQWVARLHEVRLLGRARPAFQSASIIWATHEAIGRSAPNIYRQTTRHEIAVANVSARYLARGYEWARDRKPSGAAEHMADGVAIRGALRELIEVELTPKTLGRYKLIHNNHAERLSGEGITRIVYACTPAAARTVAREADRYVFRDLRPRIVTAGVFDPRGAWIADAEALWGDVREPEPVMAQAPLFERGLQ
jgi:hypothetical protein